MSEFAFLFIAALAAAFKAVAIIIGLTGAFRHLVVARTAPLVYRHTRTELPFRPASGHS